MKINMTKKFNIILTSVILVLALVITIITGITFKSFSDYQTYFYVRDGGVVGKKAVYVILGINSEGYKDILGFYIGESESAIIGRTRISTPPTIRTR